MIKDNTYLVLLSIFCIGRDKLLYLEEEGFSELSMGDT